MSTRLLVVVPLIVVLGVTLTGCTAPEHGGKTETSATADTDSKTDNDGAEAAGGLSHHVPADLFEILDTRDDQIADTSIGPLETGGAENAFVFLTCTGGGTITVALAPDTSTPIECADDTPAMTTTRIDVAGRGEFTIDVTTEPGQTWAATIATPKTRQ